MKQFWSERFLVLREKQLDFLKNNTSTKVAMTIYLKEVSNITRSDNYPYSVELTKEDSKIWILKFDTDNEVYGWIDSIYDRACDAGALGGKLLGAGAGGFMLLFVEPKHHRKVSDALTDLINVPFRFEDTGSQIVYYRP